MWDSTMQVLSRVLVNIPVLVLQTEDPGSPVA